MNSREEKKLEKSLEHLVYEIMMFDGTVIKLTSGKNNSFETNILLESFAIHSRNLFDFFYTKKRRLDDMSAQDFITKRREFRLKRTKKRILENLTLEVNKQVAHLTYSRNNYNRINKGWAVSTIKSNMDNTIKAFINCLDPYLQDKIKKFCKKYGVNI